MKNRQTIESRLKEYVREESRLAGKGEDSSYVLGKISALQWVLED